MRAVWITRHGGPEVLAVREAPDPEPRPGEVRVRVAACGLNFAETSARKGLYPDAPPPPCVVGYEGAGTVDAVGSGVTSLGPGARVVYLSHFGGHADVVCVPAANVLELPAAMSFDEAAALPVNYLTAFHMLFRLARLRAGERVLVHMAAGGVGTAVLQLCRTVEGVQVFGTCSRGKHDYARSHGCDHPIDYHAVDYAAEVRQATGGRGVDLVLDPLGGADWAKGYGLLAPTGMLIAFGLANASRGSGKRSLARAAVQLARAPWFTPMKLMSDNRTVSGCNMGHLWGETELLRGELTELLALYERGAVRPHVGGRFSFERAGDAHQELELGRNVGKVLLVPR
ncbi:MAG: zinc-binding dehydrogenase [Polyangiaceae bacterium]|nr:zinc-binding dehydrogenase [Polyangiaceae bacterium]